MDNKDNVRESTKEISLVDMWNIFKKVWYLVLAAAIIFGAAAFVYVEFFVEPEYSSSARFYVYYNSSNSSGNTNGQVSSFDMSMARTLVGTYSEMLVNNAVVDTIKSSNREFSNLSRAQIKSMITITPNPDEMIITVSATHTDPELAYSIVNTIKDTGIEEVKTILEAAKQRDSGVTTIDPPEVAKTPISNGAMIKTAIAAVIGAIVCYAVFFAKNMFDHRVHSESDLEDNFEAPILAGIPIIMQQETKRDS